MGQTVFRKLFSNGMILSCWLISAYSYEKNANIIERTNKPNCDGGSKFMVEQPGYNSLWVGVQGIQQACQERIMIMPEMKPNLEMTNICLQKSERNKSKIGGG